eukprot:CAMPEP_0204868216 /NCGR_PEP_ID=MMETSP1348-20121228/25760_1 /ASSEMBLY_ACC=CAM_ASM_000700 /TAXON_ID=215587 /ORGANISM="Aplanochytrium stocchinoi, Strain GSBS06" /LENGTH=161 /DNA_ID=CAMNT_0052021037 /DNA_START=392 /DNA_END=877 /DNA_ORIENTATION=-
MAYGTATVNSNQFDAHETNDIFPEACDWSKFQSKQISSSSTYEENEENEYVCSPVPNALPRKRGVQNLQNRSIKDSKKNKRYANEISHSKQQNHKTDTISEKHSEYAGEAKNDDQIFQLLFQKENRNNENPHDIQMSTKNETETVMTGSKEVDEESFTFKL